MIAVPLHGLRETAIPNVSCRDMPKANKTFCGLSESQNPG